MSFKIPCGGFKLDEKSFSLDENGVLSVSGSGGGVQPDWNQNNSTATDYIKNRPFYTGDSSETVLVEESTVSFTNASANLYYGAISTTIELAVGETYEVSWDGAVYECVCESVSGFLVIGNISIIDEGADTGEPFAISPLTDDHGTEIYTLDTSTSHAISISTFASAEVTQIPDKYISDTFRDVVIAGDPLIWSENDWIKYYGLFQSGKLLMINNYIDSDSKGYVLSMFYSSTVRHMSVVSSTGDFYELGANSSSEENEFYWAPIINLGAFYFSYQQSGSGTNPVDREEYERLEASGGLTFTTKKANQEAVIQKVVLDGDKEIILSSSTSGSTKKFRITVDDSGTIKATEVT